jgi:hypothetical protein
VRRLLGLRSSRYPTLVLISNPQPIAIHPFDWEMAKESVPRAAELLSDVLLNKGIDTNEFLVRKFHERPLAMTRQLIFPLRFFSLFVENRFRALGVRCR